MPSPSSDGPTDLDLKDRRIQIRRGLAQANAAAAVILLLVVGLSLAAVRQARRAGRNAEEAERARGATERELARVREAESRALLAHASALRRAGEVGQRSKSLAAVAQAAALHPSAALRDEALAALALPDLSFVPVWTNVAGLSFQQFSPSLRCLAVSSTGGEIKVLTARDQKEVYSLPSIGKGVIRVWFSPDERLLAVRYANLSNVVWEAATQKPLRGWGEDYLFTEFCADSECGLVVDTSGRLHCVRLETGQERWQCQTGPNVTLLTVAPRGAYFALFLREGPGVQVRNTQTGESVGELPGQSPLGTLGWSEDGQRLVVGRESGWLEVWETNTWTQTTSWKAHDDTVVDVRFDPLGRWLASASWDGTIRFWSLPDFRLAMTASGYDGHMVARFDPQGRRLACRRGGKVLGFLEATPSPVLSWVHVPPSEARGAWSLEISPDGTLVAAGYAEGLRLLNTFSGEPVAFQPIPDCRSTLFTPDGQGLVTCGSAGLAYWPLSRMETSGRERVQLGPSQTLHAGGLVYAAMTADGRWLVAAERRAGSVQVYELRNPTNHFVLGLHRLVQSVAVSPDGQWVASGTWGGRGVKVWDLATGRQMPGLTMDEAAMVTFSPDSHMLVTSSRRYRVWESGTWRELYDCPESNTLAPPCAFSPDGRLLAVLRGPHVIELRVAATGQVLAGLEVPRSSLISLLRFTPDSRRLLALEWTRQILCWDLAQAHQELARLRLDWTMPAQADAKPGGTELGHPQPAAPRVKSLTGAELARGFTSHYGAWFNTLALTALVLGVFIGVYILWYHQRMMKSYGEVEALAAERNRALDAARSELLHGEKMRALGTLAAGVAHDVNNLLSIIRMGNNLLRRRDTSSEEKAESGLAVERAVEQGKKLVRSMLGYSREPSQTEELYSVPDLINEAGLLLNQQFLRGITVTLELNSDLPQVKGRRGRLHQILLNLIVNATEAMNGQGRLRIAARLTGSVASQLVLRPAHAACYIELVVEDTGPGIDPQIQTRVFEPFFSTKPRGASSGTGLGLSLVHSLADQEKLGISLQSTLGRGTTFTLWIPVADASTESPHGRSEPSLQVVTSAGR
jgi:signal transduction histidine kinase